MELELFEYLWFVLEHHLEYIEYDIPNILLPAQRTFQYPQPYIGVVFQEVLVHALPLPQARQINGQRPINTPQHLLLPLLYPPKRIRLLICFLLLPILFVHGFGYDVALGGLLLHQRATDEEESHEHGHFEGDS